MAIRSLDLYDRHFAQAVEVMITLGPTHMASLFYRRYTELDCLTIDFEERLSRYELHVKCFVLLSLLEKDATEALGYIPK